MMRSRVIHLETTLGAPATARKAVVDLLHEDGRTAPAPMAELVVTEIVSNAVLHAAAPVDMTLTLDGDRMRVEVSDGAPDRQLVRRIPGPNGGYGLPMIAALSRDWGVTHLPDRKVVWAEIHLSSLR